MQERKEQEPRVLSMRRDTAHKSPNRFFLMNRGGINYSNRYVIFLRREINSFFLPDVRVKYRSCKLIYKGHFLP